MVIGVLVVVMVEDGVVGGEVLVEEGVVGTGVVVVLVEGRWLLEDEWW